MTSVVNFILFYQYKHSKGYNIENTIKITHKILKEIENITEKNHDKRQNPKILKKTEFFLLLWFNVYAYQTRLTDFYFPCTICFKALSTHLFK